MTLRDELIPSNLLGCRSVHGPGSYITCLDCGQQFAYNHKTRRLVDFWGVHDAEALAAVRRRVDGFFSPFRGLAGSVGGLNMGIPMIEFVRFVQPLASWTKRQWTKSRHLIAVSGYLGQTCDKRKPDTKRFTELQDEFVLTSTRLRLAKTPEDKLELLNELQRIVKDSKRVLGAGANKSK